jgi:23S rRNA (pseudouridine1915-N3)-methyltransferase
MPRTFPLEIVDIKPEPRVDGKPVAKLLAAEAARIRAACRGAKVVALDERGQTWTTRMLADALARWRDDGQDVAFVIGSADGLAEEVKRGAAAVVALSALTLPHGLVRVVVAEQLYRVLSLLGGHPYHRE